MLPDHDTCFKIISARDVRFDGKIFTGVHTTGIYCRPVCPARTPHKQNVSFYPSAAAAQEAGFRPCLRCRPETAPDTGAWRGTSASVSRALRLIEEGALDEGSVEALASRLGLGERQLRRLFLKHLGASPIAVAQTRRLLLAKQLLHETTLPMAEIALAAGYGSIRRFNETFQALFQRAPSELRRSIHKEGLPSGGSIKLNLRYRAPYDWAAMQGFLAARLIQGVETIVAGVYHRTFRIGDEVGHVSVGLGKESALDVVVQCGDLKVLPQVIARVRRQFDLGADTDAIEAALCADPILAPLISARPGLRVPGAWNPFETAVRAVLGQQVTVQAAIKLAGKLAAMFGTKLDARPEAPHLVFPSARDLAAADLSVLGMPSTRVRALSALAQAVAADDRFFDGEHHAVSARLLALPGIGPWTADYIAMRALRDPDAFPSADIGLMRALVGPDGTRPSAKALDAQSQAWRPWRAYAAQHIWTSLDPKPV